MHMDKSYMDTHIAAQGQSQRVSRTLTHVVLLLHLPHHCGVGRPPEDALRAESWGQQGQLVSAGTRGAVQSPLSVRGSPTHRGPAGKPQCPGAQVGWGPDQGSSPGVCGDTAMSQATAPHPGPAPYAYSLLQRDPKLLVGQRWPRWHGLGGCGRALLGRSEEVVVPRGR